MAVTLFARNVSVTFNTADSEKLAALGPVTLRIDRGQFVSLIGPSGCGKSTLVRIFAGLQRPTEGEAYLDDWLIDRPSPRIGMMFQQANLMPWRTVLDNIALPLELGGTSKPERYNQVRALLPALGLEGFEQTYPGELSGGMAQRAALGRVLIQRPDALLLDEPFGALDALTREQISIDLLRMWSHYGQTAIMVTHDIQEAVLLSDRVIVMSHRPGRIVADIPVDLQRPRVLDQTFTTDFMDIARQVRAAIDRA